MFSGFAPYSLVSSLEEKGISIDSGTLYPLLPRLEKQGGLVSSWDTQEARPRKYYALCSAGHEVYRQLSREWKSMMAIVENWIGGE